MSERYLPPAKKTATTSILDADIDNKVRKLCQSGYQYFDSGNLKLALRQFYSAWTLLPKPQTDWEQSGWVLTALGDAYFAKGDYQRGCEALKSALHCPKAYNNPIIHLRLGQCFFELDDLQSAKKHFDSVILCKGEALFSNENDKYISLMKAETN